VHVDGAPKLDAAIYELGVPIFGICYGVQLIAQQLGGEVARGGKGEYGRATLRRIAGSSSTLLDDSLSEKVTEKVAELDVWMSHFDAVTRVPDGFVATAATPDAPMAVIECAAKKDLGSAVSPRGDAYATRH